MTPSTRWDGAPVCKKRSKKAGEQIDSYACTFLCCGRHDPASHTRRQRQRSASDVSFMKMLPHIVRQTEESLREGTLRRAR